MTSNRYAQLLGRSDADKPLFTEYGHGCGGRTDDGAECSVTAYLNRHGQKVARGWASYEDPASAFGALMREVRSGWCRDLGPSDVGTRESVRAVVVLPADEYGTHALIVWNEGRTLHSIYGPSVDDVGDLEQFLRSSR